MSLRLPVGLIAIVGVLAPAAFAADLVNQTAPMKWIEPLMPEDLPGLEYPKYFTDLDKAQAQEQAGRYKLSLITLKTLKDLKPDQANEAALVKVRALSALGRWNQALDVLSGKPVSDDPRARRTSAGPCGARS